MRLIILGATGSLGTHVLRHAFGAGHERERTRARSLEAAGGSAERFAFHTGDIRVALRSDLVRGNDALINCAGNVADGEGFVGLVDV